MFTKAALTQDLAGTGLRSSDSVLIHSSASAFGEAEDGVEGILDVFIKYFGHEGLCAFPTTS